MVEVGRTPSRLVWGLTAGFLAGSVFAYVALTRESGGSAEPVAQTHAAEEARDTEDLTELREELDRERARSLDLERQTAQLREELNETERRRVDRELEFLNLNQAVAALDIDGPRMEFAKELLSDQPGAVASVEPEAAPDPEALKRRERSLEMAGSLRALMRAEWVKGIDLLELGELSDDGWIGPVIFRLVDDRGRLSGNLTADQLRLEGSRSGRVVTILLTGGEERSGGEVRPFAHGKRRLYLPGLDVAPWMDALPELFSGEDAILKDDGLWKLSRVQDALNRMLAEDATGDVFHLRHVGGVVDGVLRDVHFAVRDRHGAMLRHLFADRCLILEHERGIQLRLEDGVTMRGESRAPFLEGRYRVFFPTARVDRWRAARLPGLVPAIGTEVDANLDENAKNSEEDDASGGDSVGNGAE